MNVTDWPYTDVLLLVEELMAVVLLSWLTVWFREPGLPWKLPSPL